MIEETKQLHRFGDFSLDATEKILRTQNQVVHLPPKTVEVLLALLEQNGTLVTKEELMEKVWPDSFVDEANLARHVYTLRKALSSKNGKGDSLVQLRKYQAAIAEYKLAFHYTDDTQNDDQVAAALALSGQRDEAQKTLAYLKAEEKKSYAPPFNRARVCIALGDKNKLWHTC